MKATATGTKGALVAALALLAAVAVAVALALGSSSSSPITSPIRSPIRVGGSAFPGVEESNQRDVGGPIDSHSVTKLEVAWTLALPGVSSYGAYASTPVVSDGVVYSQELDSNVEAIDLKSGKVLWKTTFDAPDEGPNGVTVAAGRVYGATSSAAFALDQRTGRPVWSVTLTHSHTAGIDMAPGYHNGLVYVSTVPVTATSQYAGGDVGVLWALDASTGRRVWEFSTITQSGGGGGPSNTDAGGGGLWYTPAFDNSGSMYFGVGTRRRSRVPHGRRGVRAGPARTCTATRS
jgi:glucose dehydrogenase